MKKIIFNVLIFFISSVILYLLLFIYFFFTFEKDFKNNFDFQSLENLNFYKKYSKKVHHLRQPSDINLLYKKQDLLFNKLNKLSFAKSVVGRACNFLKLIFRFLYNPDIIRLLFD